jgi:hypothetical protein
MTQVLLSRPARLVLGCLPDPELIIDGGAQFLASLLQALLVIVKRVAVDVPQDRITA